MSKGIESLINVQELLNRLAQQERFIDEQMKLLEGDQEVIDKLSRAHQERDKRDNRIERFWEKAIQTAEELAERYQRLAEMYRETRGQLLAGTLSRQERAGELYPEALKIYRQELPRAANKKEARERTQDRMVKKYPEYRKEGRIWKDSYFRQVIAKLMK